jgi:AmiR/NasT family two-component response regulator
VAEGDADLFAKIQSVLDLRDERIAALVEEVEGLNAAIEHRGVIEQAKGVIMSTLGCSADAAFAVLVQQSQFQNRKLWDIASELAEAQDRATPPGPGAGPGATP